MTLLNATQWSLLLCCMLSGTALACSCGPQDKSVAAMSEEEHAAYIYDKAQIILRGAATRVDVVKHIVSPPGFQLLVHLAMWRYSRATRLSIASTLVLMLPLVG